ncbi:MAG: antibiotic biosynthesis monooxygenase family protein [Nitrospinota bacterium]
MYARLTTFIVGPGMRSRMEKVADELAPIFKAQKGFKSITFVADDAVGEYGGFSLWETKEDAEAAAAAINPKVQEAVDGIVKGQPSIRLFEVYEPKA